jgi:hypothetical protein
MAIRAIGLDGRLMACAVGKIDRNHLRRIVGGGITVSVRAHFVIFCLEFWRRKGARASWERSEKPQARAL